MSMDPSRFLDIEAIVNDKGEDDDFESEDDYGVCPCPPRYHYSYLMLARRRIRRR